MKKFTYRNKTFIWTLITTLVLLPIFMYLFKFGTKPLSTHQSIWGDFGSYVSGIYGTLAFFVLIYTTTITRKQFQIQNEDNLFFKLYESLENRIANNSIIIGDKHYNAHQSLEVLAKKYYEELFTTETIDIARRLLCNSPEKLGVTQFMKLFNATKGTDFHKSFTTDKESFISDIISQGGFNERSERLKDYIGSRGQEQANVRSALIDIGNVYFYKISFSERRPHYVAATQRISHIHGGFLDGYLKNVYFLLEFAAKSINRDTYLKFLKAQFTKYELIIAFYHVAGRSGKLGNMKYLRELGIMDGLMAPDCRSLMIDVPSEEDLNLELKNVFSDDLSSTQQLN